MSFTARGEMAVDSDVNVIVIDPDHVRALKACVQWLILETH
jgi:hypothetical protein